MTDINPMHEICGAKTRQGTPCRNPPVTGKRRCRMHGGAKRSGAPPGNTNALKHGMYSKNGREQKSAIYNIIGTLNELTSQLQ